MVAIKINEQIVRLRKQKGITQEEMANVLGVTNQAVSKWESAQCCPDIQLLPEIAELFGVTVGELLGVEAVANVSDISTASTFTSSEDIILAVREKIKSLPKCEDVIFSFRLAAALHAIIWSKFMTEQSDENLTDTIEHACDAEWGYSCISIPELTTTMRSGAVFFSNNKIVNLGNSDIKRIVSVIKPFGDTANLKTAMALYNLTVNSEEDFATAAQISDKSGLSVEKITDCLMGELYPFILQKESAESEFRFEGMYMNIIPIISLFEFQCR